VNKAILNTEVQAFISRNVTTDVREISLKKSPFPEISSAELAEQIDSKKRCEQKLPLWFQTARIYYPPRKAIEQSSSEIAAGYKATLLEGDDVIDLTGGMGVDAYFFSRHAREVTHCELNAHLSDISSYNATQLQAPIVYHKGDGLEYIEAEKVYSTIYVDPSRRVESRRVFQLKDCEPDVVSNLKLLRSKAQLLMIKAAPFIDIQSTLNELGRLSSIHVVSIKNECKELLFLIEDTAASADPPIICALLEAADIYTYEFRLSEEKAFNLSQYSDPLRYIYEPDVALLKAGCFKLITRDFDVQKLQQHTHLYTSSNLQDQFPGRKFELKRAWTYAAFRKERPVSKANIICRNFPLSAEVVKQKLKLADGGDEYLLFCTGRSKELLVLQCSRLFTF
jgi:hypothetical protein